MNDELHTNKKTDLSLDDRFASRPHVYARLQKIADMMDQAIAQGATADEAEAMAMEQLQQLGQDWLSDWAQSKHSQSVQAAQQAHPSAIKHIKKK